MLESPIFARMRLQLLEPRKHPALLRCLLGLTMLLPQASAFQILKERIHVAQCGLLLEGVGFGADVTSAMDGEVDQSCRDLVAKFDQMVAAHHQRCDELS